MGIPPSPLILSKSFAWLLCLSENSAEDLPTPPKKTTTQKALEKFLNICLAFFSLEMKVGVFAEVVYLKIL